mmetsp:Transcript_28408/g.42872  ORF Transcript_28408/g.42872 Transcript_28408/m.42872 type:complete len:267 (-) Transcript_28408:2172-2972(-)|eukprot:scaffold7000_cov156-Skeletonema_dohrnii-CCMP3373.AAC.11
MAKKQGLDLLIEAINIKQNENSQLASNQQLPSLPSGRSKRAITEIHTLARMLECALLRLLEPKDRIRAIKFSGSGKSKQRFSIVHQVFTLQLKGIIVSEQDLLQEFEKDLYSLRTSKREVEVKLKEESTDAFHNLFTAVQSCPSHLHEDASRALAGSVDYLPCHPFEAMFFVIDHIPNFIKGDAATFSLKKKLMDIMTTSGFQKEGLVGYVDKKRLKKRTTRRDGGLFVNDNFRIVFTLYYWPYAKVQSNETLSVLPGHGMNLIRR